MKKKNIAIMGLLLYIIHNFYMAYYSYVTQRDFEKEGITGKIKPIVWAILYAIPALIFTVCAAIIVFNILIFGIVIIYTDFIYTIGVMGILIMIAVFILNILHITFLKSMTDKIKSYCEQKNIPQPEKIDIYWKIEILLLFVPIILALIPPLNMLMFLSAIIPFIPFLLVQNEINKIVDQKPEEIVIENPLF